MRLICPNCDAEYEVDSAVIPEGGRDVQCSACGHSWFQMPPDVMAAQADEAALYDAGPAATAPVSPAMSAPAAAATPATPASAPVETPRAGRSLDDSLLAVLKEEAEREAAQRRAERPGLETQTEMPLAGAAKPNLPEPIPEPMAAPEAAPDMAPPPPPKIGPATMALQKIARLRGQPEGKPAEPVRVPPPSRRELFPGIDEINSTLRASGERREADMGAVSDTLDEPEPASKGFRNGFLTVMALLILGAFLYVFAPVIESQVPALAKPMTAYVQGVDDLRGTLDTLAKGLIVKLQAITRGQG